MKKIISIVCDTILVILCIYICYDSFVDNHIIWGIIFSIVVIANIINFIRKIILMLRNKKGENNGTQIKEKTNGKMFILWR